MLLETLTDLDYRYNKEKKGESVLFLCSILKMVITDLQKLLKMLHVPQHSQRNLLQIFFFLENTLLFYLVQQFLRGSLQQKLLDKEELQWLENKL